MQMLRLPEIIESTAPEVINVDFREPKAKMQKKLLILYADGTSEEREIFKRPSVGSLMVVVGGFPEAFSVVLDGKIRTGICNRDGLKFQTPCFRNEKMCELRTISKFDPMKQVWGTGVIIFGYRFGRIF